MKEMPTTTKHTHSGSTESAHTKMMDKSEKKTTWVDATCYFI